VSRRSSEDVIGGSHDSTAHVRGGPSSPASHAGGFGQELFGHVECLGDAGDDLGDILDFPVGVADGVDRGLDPLDGQPILLILDGSALDARRDMRQVVDSRREPKSKSSRAPLTSTTGAKLSTRYGPGAGENIMNRRVSLTRSASVWAVLVSTPLLAATNVSNRPVGMLAQPAHIAPRATRATRNRTPAGALRRSFFMLGPSQLCRCPSSGN